MKKRIRKSVGSRHSGQPSKDEFARMIVGGIRQAGEMGDVTYNQERFCLDGGDGERVFLKNVYQEYVWAPKAERGSVVQRVVRGWCAGQRPIPDDFESAKPDLLPLIQSRADAELSPHYSYQPFGNDFAVVLVYNFPEATRYLVQDDLDKWGVSFREALETAYQNLTELPVPFVRPGEGVYMSAAKDDYDASRLLLLHRIRGLSVKGDPIAMVPNRDTLIMAGSDDIDALREMLKLAKDALEGPRCISGFALRFDGNDWVPWLPERSHPLFPEFDALQIQSIAQGYHEQQKLLERLLDDFVAEFAVMKHKVTGEIVSICVWSRGVNSLLPRTDLVGFREPGVKPTMVFTREEVVQVVGDLMETTGMYPERCRVTEFPTAEQLASMNNLW